MFWLGPIGQVNVGLLPEAQAQTQLWRLAAAGGLH
jgi:hypothetical protein